MAQDVASPTRSRSTSLTSRTGFRTASPRHYVNQQTAAALSARAQSISARALIAKRKGDEAMAQVEAKGKVDPLSKVTNNAHRKHAVVPAAVTAVRVRESMGRPAPVAKKVASVPDPAHGEAHRRQSAQERLAEKLRLRRQAKARKEEACPEAPAGAVVEGEPVSPEKVEATRLASEARAAASKWKQVLARMQRERRLPTPATATATATAAADSAPSRADDVGRKGDAAAAAMAAETDKENTAVSTATTKSIVFTSKEAQKAHALISRFRRGAGHAEPRDVNARALETLDRFRAQSGVSMLQTQRQRAKSVHAAEQARRILEKYRK